jgi:hypothetical protein
MLESGTEIEQQPALRALIKLSTGNISKASVMFDVEGTTLESIYKILSFCSSLELKKDVAQLCYILFENSVVPNCNRMCSTFPQNQKQNVFNP